jgi:site-specific DNA-methyltransferase (adenine-specific)
MIVEGDCIEVMRGMDAKSVDAVVTDPPYFLPAAHYSVRRESFRSLSDLSILEHFFANVFAECARVLKPTGFLYSFCDGQSFPVFFATGYRHFKKLRPLIWDKQTSINGYGWRHQHELILFAEMENAPRVPTGDGDVLRHRAVPIKERAHLAEKPVDLLERLLAKTTPTDGVVLDPFCGSGSTGCAAKALGLEFIGIERDAQYAQIARARIADWSVVRLAA